MIVASKAMVSDDEYAAMVKRLREYLPGPDDYERLAEQEALRAMKEKSDESNR